MRAFSVCFILVLFVAILVCASGNPIGDESIVTLVSAEQPISLLDVETQQGHENEGDRLARHHHGYGGWGGGHRGGKHGGYGHDGGYHGHRSGHRGGYYG